MKKIILFLLLPSCLIAQNKEARKFYGTFIENQKVFNYEFIHNPGVGYTLKVMPVTHPIVSVSESMKKLEETGKKDELNSLVESLNSLNTSAEGHKKALGKVDSLLKSKEAKDPKELTLLRVIEKYAEIDSSLQVISKDLKIILNKTKFTATRISKIQAFTPATLILGFTEVDEALKAINSLKEGDIARYSDANSEELDAKLKEQDIEKKKQAVDDLMNKNKQSLTRLREVHEELSRHVLTMLGILEGKERMETAFYEFERDIFEGILAQQLETIDGKYLQDLKVQKVKDKSRLEELATRLFYTLQTRLAFEDEKPIAGVLMLITDRVLVSQHAREKGIYRIKEISVEFEDGVIKNIEAILHGEDNSTKLNNYLRFRNLKPIGITGKFHPDFLQDIDLFCRTGNTQFLTVNLANLIAYYPVLRPYSENYAPENSVIKLIPSVGQTVIEMEKEKTSEILDVKIFSDLAGLQVGNPQGLIQASIFRKITLNTRHRQFTRKVINHNLAYLRYVTPEFVISKIDQKDQEYIYNKNEKLKSTELYRHQFVKFGAEAGIVKYSIPNAQLNFQFVLSTHWIGSNIVDSVAKHSIPQGSNVTVKNTRVFSNVNRYGFIVESRPESRWGASFRYMFPINFKILDNHLDLIKGELKNKGFSIMSFDGFIKTSSTNKFFFRWSYNRLDKGTFFHQMQLGVQSSLQRYVEDRK